VTTDQEADAGGLPELETVLAGLEGPRRLHLGAPALAALVLDDLALDEDDVARATRRGLLLAAAAGDPAQSLTPGSRAVLETASELADGDVPDRLLAALDRLGHSGDAGPAVRETALELAGHRDLALEALALVLLATG
jgi:hypothetical protein